MRLIFKNVPADLDSKSRVHKLLGEYWFYKVVPVKGHKDEFNVFVNWDPEKLEYLRATARISEDEIALDFSDTTPGENLAFCLLRRYKLAVIDLG